MFLTSEVPLYGGWVLGTCVKAVGYYERVMEGTGEN